MPRKNSCGAWPKAAAETDRYHGPMPEMGTTNAGSPARTHIGRYPVVREIGRGGMATVFLCRHPNLEGGFLAVKLYRATGKDPTTLKERHLAEAQHLLRLKDVDGVVKVQDVGIDDGLPYIVMDYREGVDLSRWAALELPPPGLRRTLRASALLDGIAGIIAQAHAHDVIHHDLKPQNIIISGGRVPRPYVVDFGTARRVDDTTMVGDPVIHGTVPYMAPEEFDRNAASDARLVDVWALGVIAYELLSGRRPFEGPSSDAVRHAILHRSPPALADIVPGLPAALEAVVARALSKEPEARQHSVDAFLADLRDAVAAMRRGRGGRLAAAGALAAAVVAGGWWWSRPVPVPSPTVSVVAVDGAASVRGVAPAFRTSSVTLGVAIQGVEPPSGTRLVVGRFGGDAPPIAEALFPRSGTPRDVVLEVPPSVSGPVTLSLVTPDGVTIPVAGGPFRIDREAPTLVVATTFADGRRTAIDEIVVDDVASGTLRIETSDDQGPVTLRIRRDGKSVGEFPEAASVSFPLHDLEGGDVRIEAVDVAGNRTESRFRVPKREVRCRIQMPSIARIVLDDERGTTKVPVLLDGAVPDVTTEPAGALVAAESRPGGVDAILALSGSLLEGSVRVVAKTPSGVTSVADVVLVRPMPPPGEAACELKLIDGRTSRDGKVTLAAGRHVLLLENRLKPRVFGFRATLRLTDVRSGNVLAEAALTPTSGIKGANYDLLTCELEIGARALEAAGWGCDVVFEDDAGHRVQRRITGPLMAPARKEAPTSGPTSRPGRRG